MELTVLYDDYVIVGPFPAMTVELTYRVSTNAETTELYLFTYYNGVRKFERTQKFVSTTKEGCSEQVHRLVTDLKKSHDSYFERQ